MMEDTAPVDQISNEYLGRIQEALSLRDWDRLESSASQWLKADPRNPSAFKWLARASVALNKIQRAAYAYGRLLDFQPANAEAKKFFVDYPSSLQDAPASLTKNLAKKEEKPGDKDPDEAALIKLLPSERREMSLKISELAAALLEKKIAHRAADLYRISYELNPGPGSLLGWARALQMISSTSKAVQLLKNELRGQPNWTAGRLLLGRILLESGQVQAAQKEWQVVIRQEPNNPDALDLLKQLAQHTTVSL